MSYKKGLWLGLPSIEWIACPSPLPLALADTAVWRPNQETEDMLPHSAASPCFALQLPERCIEPYPVRSSADQLTTGTSVPSSFAQAIAQPCYWLEVGNAPPRSVRDSGVVGGPPKSLSLLWAQPSPRDGVERSRAFTSSPQGWARGTPRLFDVALVLLAQN
jgi:hypothetical protein